MSHVWKEEKSNCTVKKVIFILFLAQAGESFAIFLHSEAVEVFVVLTLL